MCPGAVRTLHRPSADVNVRIASVRLKTILVPPRNASEVDGRPQSRRASAAAKTLLLLGLESLSGVRPENGFADRCPRRCVRGTCRSRRRCVKRRSVRARCFAMRTHARARARWRHDEEQLPVGVARIEHRHDMRMRQSCARADLEQDAVCGEFGTYLRSHHLDRHFAVVPQVVREIHGGRAARAELALDAVPAGERGGGTRGRVTHGVMRSGRMIRAADIRGHMAH